MTERYSSPECRSAIKGDFCFVTEPGVPESKLTCPEKSHHDQQVISYCRTHEKLVCLCCVEGEHSMCELVKLDDEVTRQKNKIQKLMEDIEKYSEDFQNHAAETNAAMESAEHDLADMEKRVFSNFNNIQSLLDAMKFKIIQDINNLRKQKKALQAAFMQEEKLDKIYNMKSRCGKIGKEIDFKKMLEKAVKLQEAWESLCQEKVQCFSWHYICQEANKQAHNWLGNMVSDMKATDVSPKHKVNGKLSCVMNVQAGRGPRPVTGIQEIDNYVVVTRRNTDTLMLYGAHDGKRVKSIPMRGLICPEGFVHTASLDISTHLVIADSESNQLHFLTLGKQWDVQKHTTKKLDYSPNSITFNQAPFLQELVTTDSKNRQIHVYSQDGDEKKVVHLSSRHFDSPTFVLKTQGGFAVSDHGNNQVTWVDEHGSVKRHYDGSADQNQQTPCSLALDPTTGHVLVGFHGEHCVHELDGDGQLVRTVLSKDDGIQFPTALYLSESGKLYVGCKEGTGTIMKVFQYREPSQSASQCAIENIKLSAQLQLYNWV